MKKVLFADARAADWEYEGSLPAKLEELLIRAEISRYVQPGEYVAVKLHLGSQGAYRTVRPVFVRKVVEAVRAVGGKPFIAETTRIPGLEYLEVAAENGYTHHTCGAPVILADGIFGRDSVPVRVEGGELVDEIGVASAIHDASAMVVLTHAKGHMGPGFGGAIKNISMGGLSTRTRGNATNRGHLHTLENRPPEWDRERCTWCLTCEKVCPVGAIHIQVTESWEVDKERCDRCGRCVRACDDHALSLPMTEELFARGMAEAAKAVLSTFQPGKVLYVNFALEVQPECDCMPSADTPVVQDQGIFVSDDPVAVDKASLDLIDAAQPLQDSRAADRGIREPGNILGRIHGKRTELVLEYARDLGLGELEYYLDRVRRKRS